MSGDLVIAIFVIVDILFTWGVGYVLESKIDLVLKKISKEEKK